MESYRQALIPELGSRLGDQVAVGSSGTDIFLYASSAGSADEAARVAREVLARHDVSAPVRIERWSSWEEEWLDVTDKPSADVAAEQQAEHEYLQEHERETSVTTGRPAWAMTVELRSRRDAVALAGHLAAQGWQVRRLRKDLIVWADCEDDAEGLDRALSGDAYTAFRVRRVSYGRNIPPGPPPQGPLIFGPLVRNLGSSDQQNSQVTAPHHRLRPNRVLSQDAWRFLGPGWDRCYFPPCEYRTPVHLFPWPSRCLRMPAIAGFARRASGRSAPRSGHPADGADGQAGASGQLARSALPAHTGPASRAPPGGKRHTGGPPRRPAPPK